MSQQSRNGRLPTELLEQIASRLRPACPNIPEEEFARLVEEVASIKLKYDGDDVAGDIPLSAERTTG